MPRTRSERRYRGVDDDDREDDDELENEDEIESDEADYVVVFENLTLSDLKQVPAKRISWRMASKTLVLRHAAKYQYSSHLPPSPAQMLGLAKLLKVPTHLGKNVFATCLGKLSTLISATLSATTLAPALYEEVVTSAGPGVGRTSIYSVCWADWACEVFMDQDFTYTHILKRGWLEEQHRRHGQHMLAGKLSDGKSIKSVLKQTISLSIAGKKVESKKANWAQKFDQVGQWAEIDDEELRPLPGHMHSATRSATAVTSTVASELPRSKIALAMSGANQVEPHTASSAPQTTRVPATSASAKPPVTPPRSSRPPTTSQGNVIVQNVAKPTVNVVDEHYNEASYRAFLTSYIRLLAFCSDHNVWPTDSMTKNAFFLPDTKEEHDIVCSGYDMEYEPSYSYFDWYRKNLWVIEHIDSDNISSLCN